MSSPSWLTLLCTDARNSDRALPAESSRAADAVKKIAEAMQGKSVEPSLLSGDTVGWTHVNFVSPAARQSDLAAEKRLP